MSPSSCLHFLLTTHYRLALLVQMCLEWGLLSSVAPEASPLALLGFQLSCLPWAEGTFSAVVGRPLLSSSLTGSLHTQTSPSHLPHPVQVDPWRPSPVRSMPWGCMAPRGPAEHWAEGPCCMYESCTVGRSTTTLGCHVPPSPPCPPSAQREWEAGAPPTATT